MPLLKVPSVLTLASISAAVVLSGCGGEAGTGPTLPPPPPTPPPPAPASVAISPGSAAFTALGDTLDLVAEVVDQRGATMPNATVTWRSGDETVVGVRATGDRAARVTAVGAGEADLLATAGDASASVAVTVEQIPASLLAEADDLDDLEPGTTVRVAAIVADRNGHPAPGVAVLFRVEEGGGSVDPESAVTGAAGRAETRWTLGTSGAQVLSAVAGQASARTAATLCTPLLLDPGLRLGEPRVLEDSEIDCGVAIEAAEAGAYYRVTLVGTSTEPGPADHVALSVEGGGPSAGTRRTLVTARRGASPVPDAPADPHPGRRERDRRVLSWIARPDGPDPLPDLRGRASGGAPEPPRTRAFTWGRPGSISDNCTVARSPTGVLLAHNDHIAIYADEALSPPILAEDAQVLADHYANFGQPTIQAYFGGVGDVDADGRILVFIEDLSAFGVAAFVWIGDQLAKEDCPASNEAELMRLSELWVRPTITYRTTGLVVHEAKHISSHHQLVRRARAGGREPFDVAHPSWVEEGTAEIAREISARLGWESIGGPPPGTMVRAADIGAGLARGTPEAYGVWRVLGSYGQVIVYQPHSLTLSDPYGAGWGFFRFLGDWFGGAGSARLGDAAMFARLNDAAVPVGLEGIREVTGRTFGELMIGYAQAASLTGTGSPEIDGVPRFSTYDMTVMNGRGFSHLLQNGRFPYPVTTTGTGSEPPIWLPLAESTVIEGEIGRDGGVRIHDFRAERAGDRATVRVSAPEHIRLIVTRLPDQR